MKDGVDTEIADLLGVPPEELMLEPGRVWSADVRAIGARALAYARAGKSRSYDEIGFRWMAAVPLRDATPLQTARRMRVVADREPEHSSDARVERAQADAVHIRHRPIDLPKDGHFRIENQHDMLHFTRRWTDSAGQAQQDVWTFPASAPPSMLSQTAEDSDEPRLVGHRVDIKDPGMRWLPFLKVVEEGQFPRMQECRHSLRTRVEQDSFYAFISHRWLTTSEPDPDGRQASYAAWQLVAEVCDALRIAGRRGLNTPRRWSQTAGFSIGVAGSPLGEALIVNLIRPNLDPGSLAVALEETRSLQLREHALAFAAADARLEQLRAFLHERPILSALMSRICVWYDYSCMPQAPRDPDDEAMFAEALTHLALYQTLGRTIVMLDDPDDYICRGWCLLEALTAETDLGQLDQFVGSEQRPGRQGHAEHNLEMLMKDRAHIVWRALIDTEIFTVQSAEECMSRLDLALGDPRDMPVVFEGLRSVALPRQVHADSAELWTGVLPVPEHEYGDAAIIPGMGRGYSKRNAQHAC